MLASSQSYPKFGRKAILMSPLELGAKISVCALLVFFERVDNLSIFSRNETKHLKTLCTGCSFWITYMRICLLFCADCRMSCIIGWEIIGEQQERLFSCKSFGNHIGSVSPSLDYEYYYYINLMYKQVNKVGCVAGHWWLFLKEQLLCFLHTFFFW